MLGDLLNEIHPTIVISLTLIHRAMTILCHLQVRDASNMLKRLHIKLLQIDLQSQSLLKETQI
jgi:hypothetical protein